MLAHVLVLLENCCILSYVLIISRIFLSQRNLRLNMIHKYALLHLKLYVLRTRKMNPCLLRASIKILFEKKEQGKSPIGFALFSLFSLAYA